MNEETYLRSKEESQMAASQVIFDQQRYLLREEEFYFTRQIGGFAKINKVFGRECEGYRLGKFDGNVLIRFFNVGMLPYGHGAAANVTLAGKFDPFFRGLNNDWIRSAKVMRNCMGTTPGSEIFRLRKNPHKENYKN
jgi:hypothetical protein